MLMIAYACVDQIPDDPSGFPLSKDRLKKLSSRKFTQIRKQSIGAELLLIRLLRELNPAISVPLSIDRDENGKPFLQDSSLYISFTHSDSYAACAVSDVAVGIDLQHIKPVQFSVLRRCMCPDEQDYVLSAADRDAAYTEIWTKKECYAKAKGFGMRLPLSSFSVLSLPEGVGIWHDRWDGYFLSVCSLDGSAVPELIINDELP